MVLNTTNLFHIFGILLTIITLDGTTDLPCSFVKLETDL